MTPTIEEVAGWLREEGRRIFSYWLEAAGDEFATKKSTLWFERAARVEAMGWRRRSNHTLCGTGVLTSGTSLSSERIRERHI